MKKQSIYFSLLLLLIALISCSDSEREDIKVLPDMNLVGKVLVDGTPQEGVVVSDGYTVTTTDSEGVYQMTVTKQSKFVFVSVPANCEIPHVNNIPVLYKKLGVRIVGEVLRRDFELTKTAPKDKFYLLALADVQIANSTDLTLLQGDIPEITAYVNTLKDKPIYGISLGDLVWDNMPYYKNYTEETTKIGVPTFQVIGNHDHDINIANDDAKSAKYFEEHFGPTYYSYNIGECHFVVIDDVNFTGGASKDYTGHITENQLEWLAEDLKYVDKNKLIVLGTHIPTQRRNHSTLAVSNRQDLYDILEGYKVRILSGHTHNNFVTTITEDIEENTLGAVCGAFWTGDLCNDGSSRGFAIYEIDGNKISNWYYKGTHYPRDYQMKIYPPNSNGISAARKNDIITNIFSWHTDWTVSITEDNGVPTMLTRNVKEQDPAAFDYMDGPNKPAIRPSTDPEKNNDHMLNYRPSANWQSVTVEAKDPYGNTYTNTLENK